MGANQKLSPIVTELFIRGRKINISFILILQFYFKVPKTIRLNPKHYFIMQIPNKRELQQPSRHTTSNRQRLLMLRPYIKKKTSTNFHVILT